MTAAEQIRNLTARGFRREYTLSDLSASHIESCARYARERGGTLMDAVGIVLDGWNSGNGKPEEKRNDLR